MRTRLTITCGATIGAAFLACLLGGSGQKAEPAKASGAKPAAANERPAVIVTKSGEQMVLIPGGTFEMGSRNTWPDEKPVHQVTVQAFLLDRYEVTQELFEKLQVFDQSHFKGPRRPAERVLWIAAVSFCNERSLAEGLQPCYDDQTWACNFDADGYRLPTEAEWEYACRAGAATKYSFGDDPRALKDYGWFAGDGSKSTHPVGQKKPNPWGLYDMHGNVAEWCNDIFDGDYYKKSPPQTDPRGPASSDTFEKVVRGGGWNSSADRCRSAYRSTEENPSDACLPEYALGFRCARKAPDRK